MKKIKKILCMAAALTMLAGCTAAGEEIQTVTCLAETEPVISEKVTPDYTVEEISGAFDYTLLKEIASAEENAVVSPMSVKLALTMAALGAKNDTQKELLTLFGYVNSAHMQESSREICSELDRDDGSITVNNSVWVTEGYEIG